MGCSTQVTLFYIQFGTTQIKELITILWHPLFSLKVNCMMYRYFKNYFINYKFWYINKFVTFFFFRFCSFFLNFIFLIDAYNLGFWILALEAVTTTVAFGLQQNEETCCSVGDISAKPFISASSCDFDQQRKRGTKEMWWLNSLVGLKTYDESKWSSTAMKLFITSLRKQPTFRDAATCFSREMTFEKRAHKFHTNDATKPKSG